MTGTQSGAKVLREAEFEDGPQVIKLLHEQGLSAPETPGDILAHWRKLWVDNPAIKLVDPPPPAGLGT